VSVRGEGGVPRLDEDVADERRNEVSRWGLCLFFDTEKSMMRGTKLRTALRVPQSVVARFEWKSQVATFIGRGMLVK
jgi:hypothetical protein